MRRFAVVEYLMSAGGVERVLRGLAGALLEIPEARGWDVTFLLSRYDSAHRRCEWPAALTGPRLRVEWLGEDTALGRALDPLAHAQGVAGLPFTRLPGAALARAARRLGPRRWRAHLGDPRALIAAASERFDLLFFPYPFWMMPPRIRAPVVTSPQDFHFRHFAAAGSWSRRVQERAARAWLERADRILVTSRAVEDELRRFYPEHAGKASVVPLGVDVGAAPPAPADLEAVRAGRGLPDRFLLVSGWVVPHKNQVSVVEALSGLRARGTSLPVVFVGPNAAHLVEPPGAGFARAYAERVRAALRDAGFEHGRDFFALGFVSDAELRCLFRLATLYVLPSLYEGFGLPSLEALRAGCPTLVSAIPPLEEQNRMLGGVLRTFDPGDPSALAGHIAWVLGHLEEARAAARLAGERVAEVYDWRKTARAYLAAFEEVLREREGAGGPVAERSG
jgi:glycosyltransferase involved in cell wall biosynthesis